MAHIRVVRFTDVTAERIGGLLGQIEEAGGPPPDVPVKGLQILVDEDQGTAVVLQLFDTAEDMHPAPRSSPRWIPRRHREPVYPSTCAR